MQPAAAAVPGLVTAPKYPGAQTEHAATDVLPAAEPAVHTPAGHAAQLAAPAAAEKAPAGQSAQPSVPTAMKDPAAQAAQPAAKGVPGRVKVPKKPGAHTVHSATLAAPLLPPIVVTQ